MAPPLYLPRVGAFPIFAENHPVTVMGTSTQLPLTIKKDFPLKGKVAPDFILPDHLGRPCSLHATIQLGRPIILFFFPLAGSPHCTSESCLFRDAIALTPIFTDLQAIVIGISQDSSSRAKKFVQEHHLGYRILCDEKRKVMEAYGVTRTTFGLVDNRSTFIIDPSGMVRGLAEGVLNSRGHLKFAEQWLIRLEHELSERSKKYQEIIAKEEDMIAHFDETNRQLQVIYGEERSAEHGGIGGAPRYGSAIPPVAKLPSSHRRSVSLEEKKDITKDALQMKRNSIAANATSERNMWKNWKSLLAQLSSPDDKPPPLVLHTTQSRRGSMSVNKSDVPPSHNIMTRSRSNSKIESPKTPSRRSKSKTGFSRRPKEDSEAGLSAPVPSVSRPRSAAKPRKEGVKKESIRAKSISTDDEASTQFGSVWGTDTSMENSHKSSAPSSFADHSRGSQSLLHQSLLNSPGRISEHNSQTAKRAVTSEVLMADDPPINSNDMDKSVSIHIGAKSSPATSSSPRHQVGSDWTRISSPRIAHHLSDISGDIHLEPGVMRSMSKTSLSPQDFANQSQSTPPRNMTEQAISKSHRMEYSPSDRAGTPTSLRARRRALPVADNRIRTNSWDPEHLRDSQKISSDISSPTRWYRRSIQDDSPQLAASFSDQRLLVSPTIARTRGGSAPDAGAYKSTTTPTMAQVGSGSNNLVLQSLSQTPFNASQLSLHSASPSVSSHGHSRKASDDSRLANLIAQLEAPQSQAHREKSASTISRDDYNYFKQSQTSITSTRGNPAAIGIASGLPMANNDSSPLSIEEQYSPSTKQHYYSTAFDSRARRLSQADSISSTGTFG